MSFIPGPIVKHTLRYMEKIPCRHEITTISCRSEISYRSVDRHEIPNRHEIVVNLAPFGCFIHVTPPDRHEKRIESCCVVLWYWNKQQCMMFWCFYFSRYFFLGLQISPCFIYVVLLWVIFCFYPLCCKSLSNEISCRHEIHLNIFRTRSEKGTLDRSTLIHVTQTCFSCRRENNNLMPVWKCPCNHRLNFLCQFTT